MGLVKKIKDPPTRRDLLATLTGGLYLQVGFGGLLCCRSQCHSSATVVQKLVHWPLPFDPGTVLPPARTRKLHWGQGESLAWPWDVIAVRRHHLRQ